MRKILKDAGIADKTIGYQVELVATDIVIFRMLRESLFSEESMTRDEVSREGNARVKTNPLLFALREQSKLVQAGLDKLTMNIKSKKVKAEVEDGFTRFMADMGND